MQDAIYFLFCSYRPWYSTWGVHPHNYHSVGAENDKDQTLCRCESDLHIYCSSDNFPAFVRIDTIEEGQV